MSRTVTIVGMGPGNPALLTAAAHEAIDAADMIIGAQRLLDELEESACSTRIAATRTSDIVDALATDSAWTSCAVLMSGDIGMFSGATALREAARALDNCTVVCIPGISSSVYFAAALGCPWQDWKTVSAHGIACDIAAEVRTTPKLFLVTGGQNTVEALCQRLQEAGLGHCRVSVGERLSYPDEALTCGTASELAEKTFDPLAVMLVENEAASCSAASVAPCERWPWATPGIPDDLFCRGNVPMTKQDVRALALSRLRVAPAETLYDIGAGTGSVSVELGLACPHGTVYAIERNPEGVELIQQNAQAFGVNNVVIVEGSAPEALAALPAPDAVFIGGSGSKLAAIVTAVLEKNPRVRLCVTCVTLETIAQATEVLTGAGLQNFQAVCINASHASAAGSYHLLHAENPIYIMTAEGAACSKENID